MSKPAILPMLPVLSWDGRSPTTLIGRVETRLAARARFAVLARSSPLGRATDRSFLAIWWAASRPRLAGLCTGWAVLGPDDDGFDVGDDADFPVLRCADRGEALAWLRARLVPPTVA